MTIKKSIIFFVIIIVSFLNFQFNLFHVVSSERFEYFQVESEQFVLDGYLNHKINKKDLRLGHFYRPSVDMFKEGHKYKPRDWYKNNFIEGEFWEYNSNYGLQIKIFDFFNGNLYLVQALSSIILSLVLGLIFLFLAKIHSLKFSLIFLSCLILSPWLTPIARNSYFFIFSYFLPFLITLYFSEKLHKSKYSISLMLFILYLVFLFKSLLGYDYISVIVLCSLIPIIHYFLKNNLSKTSLLKYLFCICFVSILSFSTAIFMHFNSLNNVKDPLNWIYLTAVKRLSSSDSEKTAYETCYNMMAKEDGSFDPNLKSNKDCIEEISISLSRTRTEVFLRSLIARHMIPFLGSKALKLTEKQEKDLKLIYYDENISFLKKGLNSFYYWYNDQSFNVIQILSTIINFILSPIIFIIIICLYVLKIWKSKLNEKLFYFFILTPPISCFLILKGFSYVTMYTMTYFIWYIPTVPYMLATLLSNEPILRKD